MTIADYFAKADAERILLLHIQRSDASGTCYRISDAPYATDATDTPANVLYSPIIEGMPEFRRTLNNAFDGGASTSFGTITLTDDEAAYTVTAGGQGVAAMTLPRGAEVTILLAAPRDLFPLSDAIVLATGKVNKLGGSSAGQLTIEIIDASQEIRNKPIEIDPAVGPQCYGYRRNIEPFLIDTSGPTYAVHTGAIEDVVAVYDDGVLLTLTTDYTKDNANGQFTLTGSAVGRVTCDVKGAKPSTWLQSSEDIIDYLLDEAGVTGITRAIDLPTGLIGLYIAQSTTLGEVLDEITHGCAGAWWIDRDGDFIAEQYPLPASGTEFDEITLLDEVQWEETDRLYDPIRYLYRPNSTKYQAKDGATDAQAQYAASDGLTDSLALASPVAEFVYAESPIFATLFDQQADAEGVAERLRTLYGTPRKLIPATVPYTEALDIGTATTLAPPSQSFDGAVVAVSDVFDGTYPVQRITVIA